MSSTFSEKPQVTQGHLLSRAISQLRAGNIDEAESLYRTILAAEPTHSYALSLLGTICAQRGRYEEAIALFDRAISINPNFSEAHFNRGLALQLLFRYDEALASYGNAIASDPDYAQAYWHKCLLHLTRGEYEEGWKLYEWRWKLHPEDVRGFKQPLWLGKESLAGRTILIYAEQGFGDVLQFCRYIPLVEALGAKVILEVHSPLLELLSSLSGAPHMVARGSSLPVFDLQCPLASLPLAFGTVVETIPSDIPYLFSDAARKKIWRERLGPKQRPRVGLVWSGKSRKLYDNRSLSLKSLAPLWECDCDFHCLQKDIRAEDLPTLMEIKRVAVHCEQLNDFADTAALIAEMDLVISVDTSVAHLAGALGKPLWVLLHFSSDWRWMLNRDDSPWYTSAMLLRQSQPDDWSGVIPRVKHQLYLTLEKMVNLQY